MWSKVAKIDKFPGKCFFCEQIFPEKLAPGPHTTDLGADVVESGQNRQISGQMSFLGEHFSKLCTCPRKYFGPHDLCGGNN